MIRILFLIRALSAGGAERQLIELAKGLDRAKFDPLVLTFYSDDTSAALIQLPASIRHVSLQKRGRWDLLPFYGRLLRAARSFRPHIIHGYLSGANEFALLAARLTGARAVWGLRASNVDLSRYDWLSRAAFRLGAALSRWTDLQIVNSEAGRAHYAQNGYFTQNMITIPNGIDAQTFRPDRQAAEAVRRGWGISPEAPVVGLVARLDPMKGHERFLQAAAYLSRHIPEIRFVCVGDGDPQIFEQLRKRAELLGLQDRLVWTGPRQDMTAVYNAFDLLCSSSAFGEGFSNAVGEAMGCGVPCVVTDVGDSRRIVGETGRVVPPSDPHALAEAAIALFRLPAEQRRALGQAARERILREFSAENMVAATAAALQNLVST